MGFHLLEFGQIELSLFGMLTGLICTTAAAGGVTVGRRGHRRRPAVATACRFLGHHHSVPALLLAQQVHVLDRTAAGRRLPIVDRANAADDRGRNLGFGITFCGYDCTVMLLLQLSLVLAGRSPAADIWLPLKL